MTHATDPERRFGVLCILSYVALSWAVRFDMRLGEQIASLVYPLDTFSMYARTPGEHEQDMVVRDGDGGLHRVTDFRAFDCDRPLGVGVAACNDGSGIQYHQEDLERYVAGHAGHGQLDVEVVLRRWELRPWVAPSHTSECVAAHCRVAR